MPLYLNDKRAILFKGEYKPVNLYLGDKKVAGYKYESASGKTVTLTDVHPYTNAQKLSVLGETKEVGTGEKSPDNPYELRGIQNPKVTVSDGTNADEHPTTTPTLCSLPNGVADEVDLVSGEGIRKVLYKIFDGSEFVTYYARTNEVNSELDGFLIVLPNSNSGADHGSNVCNYFVGRGSAYSANAEGYCVSSNNVAWYFVISRSRTGITASDTEGQKVDKFKTWLTNRHNDGKPVTLLCDLNTFEPFTIDSTEIPLYSPTSVVNTDKGSLEVTIRVAE